MPEEYYSGMSSAKPQLLKDASGNVKLYRTMSEAEYNQLMKTGQFAPGEGQMGNKWLSTNTADANAWGQKMDFGKNYKIVEIRVPESVLDNMYYGGPKLDNIGPAYNAECDLLNGFTNTIKTVK